MTYLELKTMVSDTLNRQDLSSAIPGFIKLAEADLSRKINHWRQEKRVTLQLDESHETLPGDWLETLRMYTSDGQQLLLTSVSEISQLKLSNPANGKPARYTINSGEFEFYPVPDMPYEITMVYRAKTPALVSDTDTNWILEYHPDAYLYATLAHTAPYLKEDERTAIWAGLKEDAISQINLESNRAKYSGSPLKMRVK